jgi:hypothetical protein
MQSIPGIEKNIRAIVSERLPWLKQGTFSYPTQHSTSKPKKTQGSTQTQSKKGTACTSICLRKPLNAESPFAYVPGTGCVKNNEMAHFFGCACSAADEGQGSTSK